MVSPKAAKEAGDKFGLHPVCAGPYKFVERVQQDRIVFEKFADYWNKDNVHIDRIVFLPIVDATVRLANLKSGGLDLIERVLATDIKDVRADPKLKLSTRDRARLSGHHDQHRQGQGQGPAQPVGQGAPGARSVDRPRGASTRSCSTASSRRATSGSAPIIPITRRPFRSAARDVAKAKALLKEAGVTTPVERRFHGAEGRRDRSGRAGRCSRWRRKPAST